MSDLIISTEHPDLLLEAAAHSTGSDGWAADARPVGFMKAAERVAVAVFQNFSGTHADLHIGVEDGRRLDARGLSVLVKLAFAPQHLNLSVLWAPIPEANTKAQIAALKMGFRFEARRRGYSADGSDVILMSLRRDQIFTTQAVATPAQEGAPTGA